MSDSTIGAGSSDGKDVSIRAAFSSDVREITKIHLAAFPGFFLSFLGPSFLRLFYAEAIALGEICCVASSKGATVGFVMGSVQPGGFYTKLIKRRLLAFGLASIRPVLKKPSTAIRVLRALLKPKQAAKAPGVATLMSVGVDPGAQGLGAGRALVSAFLDEARRRGATTVDLTTDRDRNVGTNAFYLRLGFEVAREITTPEGRVLNEYEIELRES